MYNPHYICIKDWKDTPHIKVGEIYICHENPHNGCYQIYKDKGGEIYAFVLTEMFHDIFKRVDKYRNDKLEEILK